MCEILREAVSGDDTRLRERWAADAADFAELGDIERLDEGVENVVGDRVDGDSG